MSKVDSLLTTRASKASEDFVSPSGRFATAPKVNVLDDKSANADQPLRFSMRRDMQDDGKGSSKRIIIFILVVVALGVGMLLILQALVNNQSGEVQPEVEPPEQEVVAIEGVEISSLQKLDADATKLVANSDYTTDDLSLGSPTNDLPGIVMESIRHELYETFTETRWSVTSAATGLPSISINYDSLQRKVVVVFAGLPTGKQSLLQEIKVEAGNVMSITGIQEEEHLKFELLLAAASKYYAYLEGGNTLVLRIKTEARLGQTATTSVTSVSSVSTSTSASSITTTATTTSSAAAGELRTDNVRSQSKQEIITAASGSTLENNSYYYVDYGDSFQYSWAMKNVGDNSIPNAEAELVTAEGKNYVQVQVHNLAVDYHWAKSRTVIKIDIDLRGSNLVEGRLISFENGTATYRFELRQKGDFRLHATQEYGGYKLLSLQLFDI